jgi:hypothetical protein
LSARRANQIAAPAARRAPAADHHVPAWIPRDAVHRSGITGFQTRHQQQPRHARAAHRSRPASPSPSRLWTMRLPSVIHKVTTPSQPDSPLTQVEDTLNRRLAVVAAVAITALGLTLSATPAQAGILDGSLNNLDLIDHISALNTNINSDPQYSENNNANTRAYGRQTATIAALGVAIGVATVGFTEPATPGTQDVPITIPVIGTISNGEQILETVETIDFNSDGVQIDAITLTQTFTCHVDGSGNGTCTPD